jgi:SHO1 osmosensor
MYAYNASPDDPNEVSFAKGDILEVVDNTGKWFQVRTPSGQTGVSQASKILADDIDCAIKLPCYAMITCG